MGGPESSKSTEKTKCYSPEDKEYKSRKEALVKGKFWLGS